MSVMMIAIAEKGSLLMYGTREWYSEAFFETLWNSEGFDVSAS
jgi:hypothetical protein